MHVPADYIVMLPMYQVYATLKRLQGTGNVCLFRLLPEPSTVLLPPLLVDGGRITIKAPDRVGGPE